VSKTHELVECQEGRHRLLILSEVSRVFSVRSRRLADLGKGLWKL
jgi:hypothetical protein